MTSIVLLNGGNPYDHHEFSDLYDLPEVTFYAEMASNINYKEKKRSIISEDAAEVYKIIPVYSFYVILTFIFLFSLWEWSYFI